MNEQSHEQLITQTLREYAEHEVPSGLDGWRAIRNRVQQRQSSLASRSKLRAPATRIGWAATLIVVLLSVSAATYAVAPILSRAFTEAGLQNVEESNLGEQVNLSQTINGYTVTVQRVYADSNRIVIGYTLDSSQGADLPAEVSLTNDKGTEFPAISGNGTGMEAGTAGHVLIFDSTVLQDTPPLLKLHLKMELVDFSLGLEPAPTAGLNNSNTAGAKGPSTGKIGAGPFNFSLSVPVISARSIEVQQTARAANVDVTLERLIITPSETRAILRWVSPDGKLDPTRFTWTPVVSLEEGYTYANPQPDANNGWANQSRQLGDDRWSATFPAILYNNSGEWTLAVTEIVGTEKSEGGANQQERIAGPWIFHFTLPPTPKR